MSFRTSIGLWPSLLPHPDRPPHFRFLFVRPAFCLQLPSAPLAADTLAVQLALSPVGCAEDFHLTVVQLATTAGQTAPVTALRAMPVAQRKKRPRGAFPLAQSLRLRRLSIRPRNRLSTVTGKIFRIKKRPPPPDHCIPRSDDGTLLICKSACMHVLSDDDWPRRACRHSAAGTCFTCRQR